MHRVVPPSVLSEAETDPSPSHDRTYIHKSDGDRRLLRSSPSDFIITEMQIQVQIKHRVSGTTIASHLLLASPCNQIFTAVGSGFASCLVPWCLLVSPAVLRSIYFLAFHFSPRSLPPNPSLSYLPFYLPSKILIVITTTQKASDFILSLLHPATRS